LRKGKRREVEKRIYDQKAAAHGFRELSVIKIPDGFEQPMTGLKTKCDKIVNDLKRARCKSNAPLFYLD
jgi:hypothetical protein